MMLADRCQRIASFYVLEVIAQVEALEQSGVDVIRAFIGEPDFPTPEPIVAEAVRALQTQKLGYTASTGVPALKQAIADRYQRWHGLSINPARIIVTPGGSAALHVAFLATLNPGDEVLLPEPGYPCNANILHMVNATGVAVPMDPNQDMQLSLSALSAALSPRTKALLIASPSNPLGTVMSPEQWQTLVDFCRTHELQLLADEIYHGLTFSDLACSALEVEADAWIIQSFSKFYGMTGWRLGWLVVPEYAIDACTRIAQNLYLSASTVAQIAALAGFLPAVEAICFERRDRLRERRDYLMQALPTLGFRILGEPEGAFYLYIDVSRYSDNAQDFCHDLLLKAGIALTPGLDFGGPCFNTSVRIAYTADLARLAEAMRRLTVYCRNLALEVSL